jgi:hypothetical protein
MIMRLFTHTIWIDRPRDVVFDFFTDFGEAARWRQYVKTMVPVGPGPVAAGSVIHVTMEIAGEPYAFDLRVLSCDRPTLWRHRTNETDYQGFIEYRFDEESQGTRVTMSCEARPVGWYGWLGLPLLWLSRGKSYRLQLPQLKRALES